MAGKSDERDLLEDLCIDRRIRLQWVLQKCVDSNGTDKGRQNWRAVVKMEMKFGFHKYGELLD